MLITSYLSPNQLQSSYQAEKKKSSKLEANVRLTARAHVTVCLKSVRGRCVCGVGGVNESEKQQIKMLAAGEA